MASKDYIPKKDSEMQSWTANFLTVANANLVPLGLIAGDITPITTDKGSFDTSITNSNTKQAEAKAATQQKKTARNNLNGKVRLLVRKIQANPAVTPQLKAQLGINVGDSIPTPSNPFPPTELVAVPDAIGTNKLTWNRNNNSYGTQFIVEFQHSPAIPWIFAGITTKSSFEHIGQVPGQTVFYRVKAQKNQQISETSNVAVVYQSPVV
jgi:hypothetical protein